MTDTTSVRGKAPWHLWVVGGLAVLWNAFGSLDLTLTLGLGEAWLRQAGMTDAQIAYFNAMPGWTFIAWAAGVFGGLAGAVLLLLRRRWAVHAFGVSLIGFLASVGYNLGQPDGQEMMGPIQGVIGAVCVFLLVYAWWLTKRGVLR